MKLDSSDILMLESHQNTASLIFRHGTQSTSDTDGKAYIEAHRNISRGFRIFLLQNYFIRFRGNTRTYASFLPFFRNIPLSHMRRRGLKIRKRQRY